MTGRRILVVDDDAAMVETLCDVLALSGWDPIPAYDGAEAIVLCRERRVDLVLMDIRMPRVNGVQALAAIKARQPTVPVVLITAMAPDDLVAQAERLGAANILRKPVDVPVLLEILEQAV